MRSCVRVFLLSSGLFIHQPWLTAQQAVTSATVGGRVEDASGAAIAGLTVSMANLDRNQAQRTLSDDKGRYQFLYLPAGAYALTIQDPRFTPVSRNLTLSAGQALDIPLRLSVAGLTESVTITEKPAVLDVVRTQVAETVVPKEIDALPLNGRNYLDLALLVPGVSRTNTGAAQRFAETSAVPGTGISVAGQRNLNNSFVIDGVSANDDAADLAGTFFSQEVIREFQVVTSGGIAEFGRASSGIVNITTKSGTNDWHGRVYDFFRNQRFDARNALATSKDPLTQSQYGASLGGPLRRDRTFLFSNFEQTRQNRAGIITIAPANVIAINDVLGSIGYRGPLATTGEFPTGYDSINYFARADHTLNKANQLAVRYSLYDISSTNARTVGGLNAISRGSNLGNRDQTVTANEVATLSPRTLNELRGQFTRSRLGAPINDPIGPAITINGVASLGTATSSPTRRDTDLFEIDDALSMQRGAHFLKAGAEFLYNRVNIVFPGALQGVYTFQNLASLQAGRYINFQQAFGVPNQFQRNPNLGGFVQDEFRPVANLTLTFGLRYDLQWLPQPIQTDTNNFAPRFGIAYAPGNRKTVFRASFGLYYDRIPLRATSNALQRDGSKYQVALLSFGQNGAPVFPNVLPGFPSGQYIGITTIDPHIQDSSSQQASFQIEHAFSASTSLAIGFQHLRSEHMILSRNANVPTLPASEAAARGIPNLGRPDPRFGNVSRYESSGDAYYNGFLLSLNHRAARWLDLHVAYNYSKTIDDIGNFFFSAPQNNFNLRDDRGLSDNDQRHRLTLMAVLEPPVRGGSPVVRTLLGGWQLSPMLVYTSPLPFNVQLNFDRNNDTNLNDRPVGVGRNTGAGFDFASLDVRLSRFFHVTERLQLQALLESFNTLNRANWALPNNTIGSGIGAPLPSFGKPTSVYDPRQLQLGLRVTF